jgi:ubiquinone biosynthesis protein
MKWFNGKRRIKGLRRFGAISAILMKHGFGGMGDRLFKGRSGAASVEDFEDPHRQPHATRARRIRLVLEDLGPSFVKLGQLMSTRADMFPPEYIQEFKKLQDQVPPVKFEQIEKVIEDELKQSLERLFKEFNPEPMAAASVAQVHLARLHSGEEVAVKIIRPGIRDKIEQDIRLMYTLAHRLEKSLEIGRVIGAVNLVKEFERTIFKELDMFFEAGNIERFASNFKDSHEIHICKVYWEYTTRSVLAMEHIAGIKMDRVDEIRAQGIDPKEIALIGLRSFSRQLMEFGFFHADPHPGNTIVMYDGRVGLVDFGITGYLDEDLMHHIANVFLGYAEHDYDLIINAFWEADLIDDTLVNSKNFRTDLQDISEPFYGRSLNTISVKDVYDQMMALVLKYNIRLPRNLLLLFKTLIQTEALGKILGSDASILEVTRPYAHKLLQRGYDARKVFRNFGQDARMMGGYLRMMPKFLQDILRQVAKGKQRVEIMHSGFQQIDTKFEKGINRLTVGIVISASTIAASLILNSSQTVFNIPLPFLDVPPIPITSFLGITGYSIATVLGLWLIISILRSGKM